ncbi:hypothetical protein Bca52824_081630 [Brassica carinata]|uniref:Uncharacterized protein n=1 Tax=Brassica carinata TaxID=52824 RepID=A0A8X7PFK5_BRACI|nr:hypothetical protein Bca52824_081630 [Brassica carinata]
MDPRVFVTSVRWPRSRRKIHIRSRKKMKLRWLRLHYVRLVKKIKGFYRNLVKEFVEAGAELEAIQKRMTVEAAAFAVPGLGLSFSSLSVHERGRYYV